MKSVAICGSSRFAAEIREFAKGLKEAGITVYEPHLYRASGGNWSELKDFDKKLVAAGLTHDHFYKLRLADVVYIYNQNGYSGVSTTLEIGYAAALDKPVYSYSGNDEEICRQIIFSGQAKTPAELIKYLG